VLLDEAGKNTTFIKKRLRWKGDSFMMYLRDTPSIQDDHVRALFPSTSTISDMLSTTLANANIR